MNESTLEQNALRKVAWRLIPFVCLLYLLNILDRANVGFARLQMQKDLGLSEATFNLGYGMFYVGYLLFEVPSNLLMRRVGARRWIARIMISWGVISSLTMFAKDQWTFYGLRILLGIAEAGFFPGIILYLSYWFPDRERAKMTAFFMMASGLAGVFGNPLSGLIMQYLDRAAGLHGWQWLFLLEGIPSVVLGFAVLGYLTDYPQDAKWLSDEQRNWLVAHLRGEDQQRQQRHNADRLAAIMQWRVWWLIAIYFTVAVGSNAGGAYFPTLIKGQFAGLNTFQIGLLSALPSVCAIVGMSLFGISSDRTQERRQTFDGSSTAGCRRLEFDRLEPSAARGARGIVHCAGRNDEHVAGVLDPTHRFPDRCCSGRRYRNDQLGGKHWRDLWPDHPGKVRFVVHGGDSLDRCHFGNGRPGNSRTLNERNDELRGQAERGENLVRRSRKLARMSSRWCMRTPRPHPRYADPSMNQRDVGCSVLASREEKIARMAMDIARPPYTRG